MGTGRLLSAGSGSRCVGEGRHWAHLGWTCKEDPRPRTPQPSDAELVKEQQTTAVGCVEQEQTAHSQWGPGRPIGAHSPGRAAPGP